MRLGTLGLTVTLVVGAVAMPLASDAQQPPKIFRVGFLCPYGSLQEGLIPFVEALHDLGYEEGKNISVESHACALRGDVLREIAAELVRSRVDVIVAPGTPGVEAARNATKTIPIVFLGVDDPVNMGLVASLARPGANITGLSSMSPELSAKRLELLKEVVPKAARVALLANPATAAATPAMLRETEGAARALGIQLQVVEVRDPTGDPAARANEFDRAFSTIARERASALIVLPDPMFYDFRTRIVNFAAKNRLPTMFQERKFVDAGGLISYGPSLSDQHRRAAGYVDKVLKGARPVDLPIEQPTRFELVINLKTARTLGITLPQSVLLRADQVIQ